MQRRVLRELTKTFPENVKEYNLDYCLAVNQTIGNQSNHINNITIESKKNKCSLNMHLKQPSSMTK